MVNLNNIDPDHDGKPGISAENIIDTEWEKKKLLPTDLLIIEARIRKAAQRKEDIGWLNYLFNTLLWNSVIKKNAKLDKKTLYWIMAHFDELSIIMPSPFWISVVDLIDKLGEQLYKDLRSK